MIFLDKSVSWYEYTIAAAFCAVDNLDFSEILQLNLCQKVKSSLYSMVCISEILETYFLFNYCH